MSPQKASPEKVMELWLKAVIAKLNAAAGTVHLRENDGLRLAAAVNIPPPVQQVVEWVPNGKGMAGLAMQRDEPVQTCNLQEDTTGNVKLGAKAVDAHAAIAIPVHTPTGEIRGVVGIAFMEEREITAAEVAEMTRAVSDMPQAV